MTARKLWKVVMPNGAIERPESKVKAYGIHVANARAYYQQAAERHGRGMRAVRPLRIVEVYVDDRDGTGWQLYERVDLAASAS